MVVPKLNNFKNYIFMKTSIFISIISFSIIACAQNGDRGSGNRITENRSVSSKFNKVESEGPFEIIINEGPQNGKIELEGDSDILKKIELEVEENILKIRQKKGFNFSINSGRIKVSFQAKNLRSIGLSGSGSITVRGTQNVDDFEVALSGSGDIDVNVSAGHVSTALSGSGNINLTGKTQSFEAGISGSGDVNAFGLKAENSNIGISGSGNVKITTDGELMGAIAGSGDIYYKGNPSKVNVSSGGSGDVIKSN